MCLGITFGPFTESFFLRSGWKISGAKERYLKFEASRDKYCISKVTAHSEMNFYFAILSTFFEVEMEEQE